ncbi:MAG: 16S rRNA (guanine(966)-N(2))-methyltransferase RsmD [Candidatus Omnitrophota bacterium]
MRIIAGEHKGRRIKQPKLDSVRPTKDRIREAVFNIITANIMNADVLDLFAGSGAYGLEALSRGAKKTIFVEKTKLVKRVLTENINSLGLEGESEVIEKDVFKYMELAGENNEKYDLIFADPPYNRDMARKTLIMVNRYDILNHSGTFVLEHHSNEDVSRLIGDISIYKKKIYGKICISVFRKK